MAFAIKPIDQVMSRVSRHPRPARLAILIAAVLVCVVALAAVAVAIQSRRPTEQASVAYQAQRDQLRAAIRKALVQGYTAQDLAPVTRRLSQIDSTSAPLWFGSRPDFYRRQAAAVRELGRSLGSREAQVLNKTAAATGRDLDDARGALQRDQQLGVDSINLGSLQGRLNVVTQARQQASNMRDYLNVDSLARRFISDAQAIGKVQEQENQAVELAAQQLLAQNGGDINKLRQIANLSGAHNDASIAAYLNFGHEFKGDYGQLDIASQRLERYAPLAVSGDANQVAQAAAAVQRYAPQIHQFLFAQLPAKLIVVSFQDQHVFAYQNGQAVMDTSATTGIHGDTNYGTDFGPLKVASKDHPWKMHSPYPKGSPLWYEDTWVQWTVWFTPTKLESFHDASWEADSQLGPGSQYDPSTRSHGCIHVPASTAQWMYDWSDIGTPVIVYPGNGQPAGEQLTEITTDDQGNPQTPA